MSEGRRKRGREEGGGENNLISWVLKRANM